MASKISPSVIISQQADNISVSWIFADKRRIIFLGECFRIENALSAAVPCRVFLCVKQSGYNLRYALADRRGTGESRRFDAGAVDKVWSIRQLFNNEFMVVLMGAVSGEGRDYLTDRNGRPRSVLLRCRHGQVPGGWCWLPPYRRDRLR